MVHGGDRLNKILRASPNSMALSLGVVNGRNIWKADFAQIMPSIAVGRDVHAIARVYAEFGQPPGSSTQSFYLPLRPR
jgi:hypothetical protein